MKQLFKFLLAVLCLPLLLSLPLQADEKYFVHMASEGDTLIRLGQRYMADPNRWPAVQKLNAIADPTRIRPGSTIRIPWELMRAEPAPPTVHAISGPVRASSGKIAVGDKLADGTGITTDEDGFVTLRLADGSTLVLQPKSKMRIDTAKKIPNVEGGGISKFALDEGRVEAKMEKRRGPAPRFEIATPTSNMGVRGTAFRAATDAKGSQSEVIEGVVGVASANADNQVNVAAGFGTLVAQGQAPAAPVALLPAPDLSGAATLQERILLRFKVADLKGAVGYRAQISADREFLRNLKDVTFKSAEAKFGDLDDGNYFLRVRGVDARGLEGSDSVIGFKLKARPEPPFVSAPINKAKFAAPKTDFKWSKSSGAATYRLQVSASADFKTNLIDEQNLADIEVSRELKPGEYFWRVASTRADGDKGPFGDIQSFIVKPIPKDPGPPKEADGKIVFAWGGDAGQKYEFQMARDAGFKDLIKETKLDVPQMIVEKPGDAGVYYMRFRAIDPDGFIGPYCTAQTIEVKSKPWWLLLFLLLLLK
jgi:hypothetical protein